MRQNKEVSEQPYGYASLILKRVKLSNIYYSTLSLNKFLRLGMLFFKDDHQLLPDNKTIQSLKTKVKDNKPATGAPQYKI